MKKTLQQIGLLGFLILLVVGAVMLVIKTGAKDFTYRHKSGAQMQVFK